MLPQLFFALVDHIHKILFHLHNLSLGLVVDSLLQSFDFLDLLCDGFLLLLESVLSIEVHLPVHSDLVL